MKKWLSAILSLFLLLGTMTGCTDAGSSNTDQPSGSPSDPPPAASDDVTRAAITFEGLGPQMHCDIKAKEPYKIAVIIKNTTNPGMIAVHEGAKKAAEDAGFEVELLAPATADSVEEQVKLMEDMIQKGVQGIAIQCVDSNGIMPGVRKAEAANIPVVTIGTPAAKETFMRTGCDYFETGMVIGQYVAKQLGGKGKVIVLEGAPGAQNAAERKEGIEKAFEEYPDIEIVASQTANWKRSDAMSVTENLLQKTPDVNAIIGCNDEMAVGALQAVKAANLENVVIAGFDGNADATAAIKNGEITVSYNTDPYGSGYLSTMYLVQYLNDGSYPPNYFVPFPAASDDPLIDSTTVGAYMSEDAWYNF